MPAPGTLNRSKLQRKARVASFFVNRRRDRVKILYWDTDGYALWYKRLESGTFRLTDSEATSMQLSARELAMLLGGFEPMNTRIRKRYKRRENCA